MVLEYRAHNWISFSKTLFSHGAQSRGEGVFLKHQSRGSIECLRWPEEDHQSPTTTAIKFGHQKARL